MTIAKSNVIVSIAEAEGSEPAVHHLTFVDVENDLSFFFPTWPLFYLSSFAAAFSHSTVKSELAKAGQVCD